jgi:hypothetical protein
MLVTFSSKPSPGLNTRAANFASEVWDNPALLSDRILPGSTVSPDGKPVQKIPRLPSSLFLILKGQIFTVKIEFSSFHWLIVLPEQSFEEDASTLTTADRYRYR